MVIKLGSEAPCEEREASLEIDREGQGRVARTDYTFGSFRWIAKLCHLRSCFLSQLFLLLVSREEGNLIRRYSLYAILPYSLSTTSKSFGAHQVWRQDPSHMPIIPMVLASFKALAYGCLYKDWS